MNTLTAILKNYEEFQQSLQQVDLQELKKQHTRQELNQFLKDLREIPLRSLSYEIGQLIQEMKEEEYPELLGVHHFPVLREIDFLSEEQKKVLDDLLVRYRIGHYVFPSVLYRLIPDRKKVEQLSDWLVENRVVRKEYRLLCPHCSESYITPFLSAKEKQRFEDLIQSYKETADMDLRDEFMAVCDVYCDECDEGFELWDIAKLDNDFLEFEEELIMTAQRDTSLDNV